MRRVRKGKNGFGDKLVQPVRKQERKQGGDNQDRSYRQYVYTQVRVGGIEGRPQLHAPDIFPVQLNWSRNQHETVPVGLLGRLFRSESSHTEKKNLIIFVTPRIIDPAGNPVHTMDNLPYDPNTVPPQKPMVK